jgi:internalin A
LWGTKITDAGLKELAALRNLQRLKLASRDVTDAGVEELRKALPNCDISP